MLNTALLNQLYKAESKERQQELIRLLFKKSRQTMNYFKRTKDVGLSKLEIMSDFFGLPIDSFREGNSFYPTNVKAARIVQMDNAALSKDLQKEKEKLQKQLESKENQLEQANKTLEDLRSHMEDLRHNIETYKDLVKAKDEALKAKDEALKAKDDVLKVKDEALKVKDEALKAKDEALKAKDDDLKAKEDALKANKEFSEAKDFIIQSLKEQLALLEKKL